MAELSFCIRPHAWAEIGLVVLPDAMIISVSDQERYRTSADFSQIDQTLPQRGKDKDD